MWISEPPATAILSNPDFSPKSAFVNALCTASVDQEIEKILQFKALSDQHLQNLGPVSQKVNDLVNAFKKQQAEPNGKPQDKIDPKEIKICIVGGGVSGLYSAYILQTLGIDYEILEANPDRIGGRLYTHHFTPPTDRYHHDYYDIGGMRFPNTPVMKRTFQLFAKLDIGRPGSRVQPDNRLMPYYLQGRNCPTRYNDITDLVGNDEPRRTIQPDGKEKVDPLPPLRKPQTDPFKVSTRHGGSVPASRVSSEATEEILEDAFDRFRAKIMKALEMAAQTTNQAGEDSPAERAKEQLNRAYEYLLRHDKYSLRDYLLNVEGYDPETVHWLETTDSASGWYDQAFVENVIETLAFNWNKPPTTEYNGKWYCIEGGSGVIIDRLCKKLQPEKILQGKLVTKMALLPEKDELQRVAVSFRDAKTQKTETRQYSAVLNSTTLGALSKIDLTGMEIPWGMKTAIRVLRYEGSSKIGIKFKKMWWKQAPFNISLGGVARTDMPIRVCVYPSYNVDDDPEKEGVLLASYSWGQDSERIAAHIGTDSPAEDKGLRPLLVYNLARLHTPTEPKDSYEERFQKNSKLIDSLWLTHHAYDWSKDEYSAGAFALFGPGQFTTLIPHLIRPASDGRLAIIGEHASANHAWVVGALDSAVRGLSQVLTRFGLLDEIRRMVKEFGEVNEISQELVAKQVILSSLSEDEMAQLRLGKAVPITVEVGPAGTTT